MKVGNLGLNMNHNVAKVHVQTTSKEVTNDDMESSEIKLTMRNVCNKFVIGQIVTSMISSFCIPFVFYSIILLPFSTTVVLLSFRPLFLFILSPWLCAVFSPLFLPILWPEALQKKTVIVFPDNYFKRSENMLLFLKHDKVFRFGIIRNILIGTYLAIIWVPLGILFCIFCGPVMSMISYISFACLYISCISGCTTLLSIISYSIFSNSNRVIMFMKSYPSYIKTLSMRMIYSPFC